MKLFASLTVATLMVAVPASVASASPVAVELTRSSDGTWCLYKSARQMGEAISNESFDFSAELTVDARKIRGLVVNMYGNELEVFTTDTYAITDPANYVVHRTIDVPTDGNYHKSVDYEVRDGKPVKLPHVHEAYDEIINKAPYAVSQFEVFDLIAAARKTRQSPVCRTLPAKP